MEFWSISGACDGSHKSVSFAILGKEKYSAINTVLAFRKVFRHYPYI